MSIEMVSFLDTHALELSQHLGSEGTKNDLIRESVARTAWDYFGIDIE